MFKIGMILKGEEADLKAEQLSPLETSSSKFASVTSCDVGRSF